MKTYQEAGLLETTGGVKRLIEPVLLVLPAVLQDIGAPPCSPHANLVHAYQRLSKLYPPSSLSLGMSSSY